MADTIAGGEQLALGTPLVSEGGFARLIFQADGNLVLYTDRPSGQIARWASNTAGMPADRCVMQEDGNLVIYNGDTAIWATGTWTFPGARLVVQHDENVVIYQGDIPVWASGTSLDGQTVRGETADIYYVFEGVRHRVPDQETLDARFGGEAMVVNLSAEQVAHWPEGDPVPTEPLRLCSDRTDTGPAHPARQLPPPPPPRIRSDGTIEPFAVSKQQLVGVTEKMWDAGQTVRVKLMGGSTYVRGKVREYAEQWTQHANINFQFVDRSQPAEIRVAFDPGGSWSTVGRDALWTPFDFATMNFGWLTDTSSESEFSRVILHEFGHALGLVHEHQSPVGGIPWDREKVYQHYQDENGWSRADVDSNVFDRYSVSRTNYSQFDTNSVMCYWVPPSVTLDGSSYGGATTLSDVDKQYIARWYPHMPVPGAAVGLLRTGDDCDEIDFRVDYNVVGPNDVAFRLQPAGITWWKAVDVPVGAAHYHRLEMQDGRSAATTLSRANLDTARPLRFNKAKFLGVHTRLGYTWDVLPALPGGSRLTLVWKRDSC